MTVDRTGRFWQSVDRRAMELPRCGACGRFHFYPRPVCPECWSDDLYWRPVSGRGTVWSYTVVRFAHGAHEGWKTRVPHVVALIELEEGVRMMGNVVDCPVEEVRSGMAVELDYREYEDGLIPVFVPAG